MENEASTALKMTMSTMNIKYQLVPPNNHRAENAEISIQSFKNHFISGPCSVDKYPHTQLQDRLLYQATVSLNLLRQSIIFSHPSSYTQIFGEFDYNLTPLSPPGTRIVTNSRPNNRASWAPYGEYGW